MRAQCAAPSGNACAERSITVGARFESPMSSTDKTIVDCFIQDVTEIRSPSREAVPSDTGDYISGRGPTKFGADIG